MMTDQMLSYYLEITIDGGREINGPQFRFDYYKDPQVLDIQPSSGPVKGGTIVKIVGKGFNCDGSCNKTTRFSVFEQKPNNETNDTFMFVTSPPANVPDAVVVAVALNG